MRKKQWILLLVVLAAFVAATAGMRGYQNKKEKKAAQKEEAEKVYALQFSSDDVTGIAYEKDGEWLAFTKNDDTWSCETDTAASIDSDKMKTMLSSLGSMTADNTVESPADIAQYGLDEPSMQAILRQCGKRCMTARRRHSIKPESGRNLHQEIMSVRNGTGSFRHAVKSAAVALAYINEQRPNIADIVIFRR